MTPPTALITAMIAALLSALPAAGQEEGFIPLFNGKDLSGWTGGVEGYRVVDGLLMSVEGGKGNLMTEGEYANFILRLEFKLTPLANNGVAIRCPSGPKVAPSTDAMEIQIIDDTTGKYKKDYVLKDYQYCGSIYGVVAPKKGQTRGADQWNQMEITANGRRVTVTLNGVVITDADLDEAGKAPLDGKPHPGLKNEKGRIGLLGHSDVVYFRNLRVKPLE
jgi:hypothetical protein